MNILNIFQNSYSVFLFTIVEKNMILKIKYFIKYIQEDYPLKEGFRQWVILANSISWSFGKSIILQIDPSLNCI